MSVTDERFRERGREQAPTSCAIFAFLCLLISFAEADPENMSEAIKDSIPPYSNIRILTTEKIKSGDGAYCDELSPVDGAIRGRKGQARFSAFHCAGKVVNQFTFVAYEGDSALVLYRPFDSNQAYFGKAKIKMEDIRKAFILHADDPPERGMTEKQADVASGAAAVTALIVIATLAAFAYILSDIASVIH